MNYVIITSAFNEEKNVERTINSVLKQTVLPQEWVFIDDGSTDNTCIVIQKYLEKYDWIKLYSYKKEKVPFGEHVYANFYKGITKLGCKNWDIIVKLDADLDIDREDFFEFQINKMTEWPELGICSGITYSDYTGKKIFTKNRHYWRTGGAMKVYRKTCLEQIGGIKPIFGWDGLDEYQAMYHGWKTRTFFELPVNHLGKKRALGREKQLMLAEAKGKSLYMRGYPVEFVLLKSFTFLKKSLAHMRLFLKGYFKSKKSGIKQIVSKKEKKFFRKLQYLRVLDTFTVKKLL